MNPSIQNAKHDLRREMSLLGYTHDQMAEISPIIARFTKRVVVAELAMREAARAAMRTSNPGPFGMNNVSKGRG